MRRILNSPGKYPSKQMAYVYSRIGRITRVDYETMVADVEWLSNEGGSSHVTITTPHWSKRAFMGVMYEVDQIVLCEFVRMGDQVEGFISRSLPCIYRKGLNLDLHRLKDPVEGLNYSNYYKVDLEGKDVVSDESGYFEFTRYKHRKLYPGEGLISSSAGSDVLVNDSITLSSSSLDTLKIDGYNGQTILNTLQKIEYIDGVRSFSGSIERPVIECFNLDGSKTEDYPEELDIANPPEEQNTFISPDSHKRWIRTLSGEKSPSEEVENKFSVLPFIENRYEIQEFGDMLLSVNPHLHGLDLNYNDMGHKKELKERNSPIIESSSGTLVGFDNVLRQDIYGKVLQPQIYSNKDSTYINLDELEVVGEEPDYSQLRFLPASFMWKMPHEFALTRFYIAKEGNLSFYIGATWDKEDIKSLGLNPSGDFEHQLGAGRSIDGYLAGSLKLVVDKNRDEEESIILDTIGQVRFHLGKDDGVVSSERRECKFNRTGELEDLITGVTNPILTPGNNRAEFLSVIGTLDGGISLRVGANNKDVKRKFYKNGFNATGRELEDTDVRDEKRQTYGEEDSIYQFHDMTKVGEQAPEFQENPISDPDIMGHSLDAHLVQNMWLRIGKDKEDNKSLTLDTDGSSIIHLGKDNIDENSISLETDGGLRSVLGYSKERQFSVSTKMNGGITADIGVENQFDRSLILNMVGGIDSTIGVDNLDNNSLITQLLGGVKANVGKENTEGQSLILELDGGMKIRIGRDDAQNQSVNVQASNGMEFIISDVGGNGYALKMVMNGDVLFDVNGNFVVNTSGNFGVNAGDNCGITANTFGVNANGYTFSGEGGNTETKITTMGNVVVDSNGPININSSSHTFGGPDGGSGTTVTAKGKFRTPDDQTKGHDHPAGVGMSTDTYE